MQLLCETETSVHLSCITNKFIDPVLTAGSTLRAISRRSMLWTKCITLIRYEKWHLKSVIVASAESTGYTSQLSWVQFPVTAVLFTFRLKTCKQLLILAKKTKQKKQLGMFLILSKHSVL